MATSTARATAGRPPAWRSRCSTPHLARPSAPERFRREAKNAAALTHPNIIEIVDHGETEDGVPYMVMELLAGDRSRT
jgi:serine/threonine protein kinase